MTALSEGPILIPPATYTLTNAWANVGLAIKCLPYTPYYAFIDLDINDSKDVRVRFRGVYEEGGKPYVFYRQDAKKDKIVLADFYFELDDDDDQDGIIEFKTDQNLFAIQLQIMAVTPGATAGIITAARYRQGYIS